MRPGMVLAGAVLAGAVLASAACTVTGPGSPARSAKPVTIGWRSVTLPLPAGDAGRAAPRDAVICAGKWYVVGAVIAPDGAMRPAIWSSTDAATFTPVTLDARTFYGRQNMMYTVGCRDGRIAAVGAKSGGAHGNPRVSTWYQRADGSLTEVEAYFELYGGGEAVGVSRIAGGPRGWLIAGNRTSGAAVWVSADATEFELIEYGGTTPSGAVTGGTAATDVNATADGWLVVGSVLRPGRAGRDPAVWISTDGRRWEPADVPDANEEDESMLRVVAVDGGLLAVGVRGDAFGAWRQSAGSWAATGRFGRSRGRIAADVGGIAAVGNQVLVATQAEEGRRLWLTGPTGATAAAVTPPRDIPAGGNTALTVVGGGGVALLLADDGHTGGAWLASGPLGETHD